MNLFTLTPRYARSLSLTEGEGGTRASGRVRVILILMEARE